MNDFELTLLAVLQLYGAQSRAIDTGAAQSWADTFTASGRFESPTYPEPVVGREALISFAEGFTRNTPRARHVITNAHLTEMISARQATAAAYLMVVQTSEQGGVQILRLTTIEDELVMTDGVWKVSRRRVTLENKGK
ncbi:nuclear transport factor 2 family protein [Specibacter sp. RAF43]|uniref:nuclear transport factor 2 family protein n=1 Tax=Specibacter sp. RAF43 TaxID=3233057 RepID=UPI003F9BB883